MLFYQYLHNNGEKVTLGAIKQPDKVLKDHMDLYFLLSSFVLYHRTIRQIVSSQKAGNLKN